MPQITFVSWNIENFGHMGDPGRRASHGPTYRPICNFIARTLHEVDADIFAMQELTNPGIAFLPTLQASLNNLFAPQTWSYDYIPGAVKFDDAINRPINDTADLGFTPKAHSEGYAVFWREDATKFRMLRTRETLSLNALQNGGEHFISLVFEGRGPQTMANGWFTAPNFTPNVPYAWQPLDFVHRDSSPPGKQHLRGSRRPCYFVVELTRPVVGGVPIADRYLPFVIYHAPFERLNTSFGVQLSGYSRQLYQVDITPTAPNPTWTNTNQAIMAGDFNIDSQTGEDADAYNVFLNTFNTGGANCTNQWVTVAGAAGGVNFRRKASLVKLNQEIIGGPPITSNKPSDYRDLAIDNIFYRNTTNVLTPVAAQNYHGEVFDLISAVMRTPNPENPAQFKFGTLVNSHEKRLGLQNFFAALITELHDDLDKYPATMPGSQTPVTAPPERPIISKLLNYPTYENDIGEGFFPHARQAAEFVHQSVSDHLPVVFRFTF